jgi:chromosome partitioning protein
MNIFTIASTKGGVGKSTFILNLATVIQNTGKKVAILDADAQGTVSKWNKVREYIRQDNEQLPSLFVASARGEALLEIAADKKQQGYTVLIDSAGVDDSNMRAALLRSDYVITTCPPSPVDLWEVETLLNILKKLRNIQNRKIPLILVFNKVPPRYQQGAIKEAQTFFDTNNIYPDYILPTCICERAAFKHSIKDGTGVIEYSPQDPKAIAEIKNCFKDIELFISSNKKLI